MTGVKFVNCNLFLLVIMNSEKAFSVELVTVWIVMGMLWAASENQFVLAARFCVMQSPSFVRRSRTGMEDNQSGTKTSSEQVKQ